MCRWGKKTETILYSLYFFPYRNIHRAQLLRIEHGKTEKLIHRLPLSLYVYINIYIYAYILVQMKKTKATESEEQILKHKVYEKLII